MVKLKERASAHESYEFPLATVDFIQFLDETYPERCVREGQDEISAHRYAAVRQFIDELVSAKDDEYMNGYADD